MTKQLVRVDTHRVILVLYGLCGAGRAGLAFEVHPDDPGSLRASFTGRNGGTGSVAIPDDKALRDTLNWLASHPKAELYLRAVLAAVRACDGVLGGWAAERALELLWGPRKPRRSRARKLPPVRSLVDLLRCASWELAAPVAAPAAKAPAAKKDRRAQRASYGGTFVGVILSLDAATRTVHLHADLRRLLDGGPYDMRPVALFAARANHPNPRGRMPSRALSALAVHGAWDYARFRQQQALQRGGVVQALRVEDLLGRWTGVDVEALTRRGLMASVVDRLEEDLADAGDISLAEPIRRERHSGRCELRLRISLDRRPRSAAGRRPTHQKRGAAESRQPPVTASATGKPNSTAPPRA